MDFRVQVINRPLTYRVSWIVALTDAFKIFKKFNKKKIIRKRNFQKFHVFLKKCLGIQRN